MRTRLRRIPTTLRRQQSFGFATSADSRHSVRASCGTFRPAARLHFCTINRANVIACSAARHAGPSPSWPLPSIWRDCLCRRCCPRRTRGHCHLMALISMWTSAGLCVEAGSENCATMPASSRTWSGRLRQKRMNDDAAAKRNARPANRYLSRDITARLLRQPRKARYHAALRANRRGGVKTCEPARISADDALR
jgi:hypothetical protein